MLPTTPAIPDDAELDASFASDNSAGLDPRVASVLIEGVTGQAEAYGGDTWSPAVRRELSGQFGEDVTAFFVSTGTAANVLAIGSLARPGDQVLVSACAHVYNDEGGSIEAMTGCSMRALAHEDGKVEPTALAAHLDRPADIHAARPRIVSLAQATELGTIYQPAELTELCRVAHDHDTLVHLDGARLANAAAALGTALREVSFACGVDVLSFGSTKNGTMNAETVLFRGDEASVVASSFQKQLGQLHSKQRYLAAQVAAVLHDDVWRKNALAANYAARALGRGLDAIGAKISYPVETNAVFATLDADVIDRLRSRYVLLDGIQPGEIRFMTSFATTSIDIDRLLSVATEQVEPTSGGRSEGEQL